MADLGPLAGALLELLGPALRALLKSALGMALLAVGLSAGAFYLAADGSPVRGALAALCALGLGAVLGAVLALKRAVLSALLAGLERLDLGGRALRLVFARMAGEGSLVARAAEQVPLGEAETRLRAAVAALLREEGGGFLRRRLRAGLLQAVERVTLSRFRAAGAAGGVDLGKVEGELAGEVNGLLEAQVRAVLTKLTVGVVLAAAVLSLGAALLIRRLPIGSSS